MIPKAIRRIDKYFVTLLQRLGIAVAEEDKIEIEEALIWMNKRVEDRIKRNVLGTYNK